MNTDNSCCFLNTYKPLIATEQGRNASVEFGICPFVDGSIRREPDLQHTFPAISCICRKGKFAPRLRVGNMVGYMTVKGAWGTARSHRRLTAVLEVIDRCDSHAAAATWYRSHDLPVPNNCMVSGNPPKPLEQSHMLHSHDPGLEGNRLLRRWDAEYKSRAIAFPIVVICKRITSDSLFSWTAPIVEDEYLIEAFGRIPGTQNPGALSAASFRQFMTLLGIVLPPSSL